MRLDLAKVSETQFERDKKRVKRIESHHDAISHFEHHALGGLDDVAPAKKRLAFRVVRGETSLPNHVPMHPSR
jgi:hypothetical protein